MAVIAISFIMIGNLNALAPIVTMPFLLTYAAIDYAYFKLAMSYDIRQQQKLLERKPSSDLKKSPESRLISSDFQDSGKKLSYGSSSEEKYDLGEVKFGGQDAIEKDDSQEKENKNKDDNWFDYNSPLDMPEHDTAETKVNLEGKDGEKEDTEVFKDTTKLLQNGSNKDKEDTLRERRKSDEADREKIKGKVKSCY